MPLPDSKMREGAPVGGFLATPTGGIPVLVGVSADGTMSPRTYGDGRYTDIAAQYKAGPLARKGAYVAARSGGQCVAARVPKTARSASKPANASTTRNDSSNFGVALTGIPTWGADVVIKAIVGGTTGTSGITYQVSTDGGATFSATSPLGTAEVIAVLGVTVTLGNAKVVTAGDLITWPQRAASAAIGPMSSHRVDGSTGTVTPSGSPEDAYRWRLELLSGGTVGEPGITYRTALDWNGSTGTWSRETALGAEDTITIMDGGVSSGITLTLSGEFDSLDAFDASTTEPEASYADIQAALTAVRATQLKWSFIAVLSPMSAADATSLDSLLTSWSTTTRRTWAVIETRDRESGESIEAHLDRVIAEYASFTSTRVFPSLGHVVVTCPTTGRRDRRAVSLNAIVRLITAAALSQDPGMVTLGPLPVTIADADGAAVELDSRLHPDAFDANFLVVRTWEDDSLPGVYLAGGVAKGPPGNLGLISIRRVLDAVQNALQTQARLELVRTLPLWTAAHAKRNPTIAVAGNIYEPTALAIEERLYQAAYKVSVGRGDASGLTVALDRTPVSLGGGKYGLKYSGTVAPLGTVYDIEGIASLEDPALS